MRPIRSYLFEEGGRGEVDDMFSKWRGVVEALDYGITITGKQGQSWLGGSSSEARAYQVEPYCKVMLVSQIVQLRFMKATYIFEPKELITAILSYRISDIRKMLLQRCRCRRIWIFLHRRCGIRLVLRLEPVLVSTCRCGRTTTSSDIPIPP